MYGVRYIGEWLDNNGGESRFEILERDYTGVPEQMIMQGDPLIIERSVMDNKFQTTVGSGLELNVEAEYDGQYLNTYTSDVKKYQAILKKNGTIVWLGYLNTEVYSEDYSRLEGYPVQLNFNDGFAALERLLFVDDNGANYSGLKTAWEVLWIILDKLELNHAHITVACDSYHKDMDRTKSPLHQFSVNCDNYYDEKGDAMNCREVLDAILQTQRATCFQSEGNLTIVSVPLLAEETYNSIRYSSITDLGTLEEMNNTLKIPGDADWYLSDQQIDIIAACNRATIKYSPYSRSILIDSNFNDSSKWIGEGKWIQQNNSYKPPRNGSNRPIYDNPKGGRFYKLEGVTGYTGWEFLNGTTISGTKSDMYEKEDIYAVMPYQHVVNNDTLLSVSTAPIPAGSMSCGYELSFSFYVETKDNEFDDTEDPETVKHFSGGIRFKIGGKNPGRLFPLPWTEWKYNGNAYYGYGEGDDDTIADKWHKVSIAIPGNNPGGAIDLEFVQRFHAEDADGEAITDNAIKAIRIKDIKLKPKILKVYITTQPRYGTHMEDINTDDLEFVATMDDSWSNDFTSIDMIHGDSFDLSPTDRGALFMNDKLTQHWQTSIDTDSYYNIAELVLRSIVSNYRTALKQLSGTIFFNENFSVLNAHPNILAFNSVITLSDQHLSNKRLMFMGGSYNDVKQTLNGTWLEVLKDELTINN